MERSDLSKIANKVNADILAIKKQYAKNMCKWIEERVATDLKWMPLHHANNGHVGGFVICDIKRHRSRYMFFGTRWQFDHYEMDGPFNEWVYNQNWMGSKWGPFFDVKSVIINKLKDLSMSYDYNLVYQSNKNDYGFYEYTIIAHPKKI